MEKVNKLIIGFGLAITLFALAFCIMFLQEPLIEVILLIPIFCFLVFAGGVSFIQASFMLYKYNNKVKLQLLKIKINPILLTKAEENGQKEESKILKYYIRSIGFLALSVVFYLFI